MTGSPQRTRVLSDALPLLFVLVLEGCSGSGSLSLQDALSNTRVSISPPTAAVAVGDTQQFSASVTGARDSAVIWSVNGIDGGNTALGTITSWGLYVAPDVIPSPSMITVTVTSQANTSQAASASGLVIPKVSSLNPIATLQNSSAFVLRAFGQGFTAKSRVVFGGAAKPTTQVSSSELRADISSVDIAAPGLVPVTVQDGGSESVVLDFAVVPPLERREVSVAAGLETSGVNIAVSRVSPPALMLVALGVDDTTGSTGISIPRGSEAQLLLVGKGISPGTFYLVDGGANEFDVTQPVAEDFAQTTDGIPAVHLRVFADRGANLGPRNILVLNPAGEVAAFVGGILVTE